MRYNQLYVIPGEHGNVGLTIAHKIIWAVTMFLKNSHFHPSKLNFDQV